MELERLGCCDCCSLGAGFVLLLLISSAVSVDQDKALTDTASSLLDVNVLSSELM